MFREPRWRATYSGIWLHMWDWTDHGIAAGHCLIGLVGMGAPAGFEPAHTAPEAVSGPAAGVHLTCGDAPEGSLEVPVLSQLYRGCRYRWGRRHG